MNNPTKKHTIILTLMAVMAIFAFAVLHVSCHSGAGSLCLLTMCAFILTSFSIPFLAGVNPLLVNIPARRGVSIPFRLERPPRI
ncbi:MAG: hypothetical protein RRA15_03300 [bacterium]|nr:hypothetical protein [bacterium]